MSEEMIRAYADLRAKKLMLNGAQSFVFKDRVIQLWLSGSQAEHALTQAAKDFTHAN